MQIEALEVRQFLSAATDAAGSLTAHPLQLPVFTKLTRTGTLFIRGSSARDTISFTSSGGSIFADDGHLVSKGILKVEITMKGPGGSRSFVSGSFDQAAVKRIDINSGAGDDFVDVNVGITGRTVMHGGKGDDRLQTTGNHSSLFGDSGDDVLTSNTSVGIVRMAASDGTVDDQRTLPLSFNLLSGGDGADTFRSRGGDDSIVGGSGADRFEPLEAGIAMTNGVTLPTVNYAVGTKFGASRVALSDVGVTTAEPDQQDVRIFLTL